MNQLTKTSRVIIQKSGVLSRSAAGTILGVLPSPLQFELKRRREWLRQSIWNRVVAWRHYPEYLAVQTGSSAYSRQHPTARFGTEKSINKLIKVLEPLSVVLDAGCGDGYALDLLQSAECKPIGIDVNIDKLQNAKHYGSKLVLLGDMHHLPLSSNCIDAIHCSHVLEHMLVARQVLLELRRVLKSGGIILFVLPLGPANYKHPTAFLDERDVRRMIELYFQIEELGVEEGRGGLEVTVLARKHKLYKSWMRR